MGWPLAGVGTCKYHGGGSAASRRKHKRTLLRNEEQRQLALNERRFQPIVDADPATVLIDLVRQQAGIVAYLRERLETVSEGDLVFGVVSETEHDSSAPGSYTETVRETRVNIVYQMLQEAQRDLRDFAATALKAGVEERQIVAAERQADAFVGVLRGVLTKMFERAVLDYLTDAALLDPGTRAGLREQWNLVAGSVVPEELRLSAQRQVHEERMPG